MTKELEALAAAWLKQSESIQRAPNQTGYSVVATTYEQCARELLAVTQALELTRVATEVLERYGDTFKRLAEAELEEAYQNLSQVEAGPTAATQVPTEPTEE